MRILRNLDKKNYNENLPKKVRIAVRAIIIKDGKIAVIRSKKYGEYKLPGGGIDSNETFEEALVREVMEETGLMVIPGTIKEYGTLIEKRKDLFEEAIFEQVSYYYTCDVEEQVYETHLSLSETELGYKLYFVSLEEAINNNSELLKKIIDTTWIERETYIYKTLLNDILVFAK